MLAYTDEGLAYRPDTADEWIIKETSYSRLLKAVRRDDRVLDVGGYIGSFAMAAAKQLTDPRDVISFEPSPRTFPTLERNATIFGFTAINAAVVDWQTSSSTITFYDAPDDRRGPYASLMPKRSYQPIEVETIAITAVQSTLMPTVVKIDVEGYELRLLHALELAPIRCLAVEYELRRDRLACCEWDDHLVKLGFERSGQPLLNFSHTSRSAVKTYLR